MFPKDFFKKPQNELESAGGKKAPAPVSAPAIPEEICVSCPSCKKTIFKKELAESGGTCPHCGHCFKIGARARIELIADKKSFREQDKKLTSTDTLSFPEYEGKLEAARRESKENEAVITGTCEIGGFPCAIFVMEPRFIMGSMGRVVGEKITRLFEHALAKRLPVIGYTVSGGARMQEGIISLMQMAKVSGAVKRHSDAGLLYTAVLTNPTTGGVTASFAMQADIILAEPGALIGFAGPRVIEQTIRQKLPEGFQRAEYLKSTGFTDDIIPRGAQKDYLARILKFHAGRHSK